MARFAAELGIADWRAELTPADKTARLAALAADGRQVLMVGDGLNDAPALAAAFVSISPASAADISQTAADAVFQGEKLGAGARAIAGRAPARAPGCGRISPSRFGYNLFSVPLAMAGFVTPLVAAVAMSSSSLLVTGNALRLGLGRRPRS